MTRRIIRIYKKYTKTRNKRVRLTRCHLQRAGLHCSASIVLNGPLFTLFLFTLFRPRPCRPRPSCHDASRHTRSAATMLGGDDAGAAGGAGGDGDDGRAGGNAGNGGCARALARVTTAGTGRGSYSRTQGLEVHLPLGRWWPGTGSGMRWPGRCPCTAVANDVLVTPIRQARTARRAWTPMK